VTTSEHDESFAEYLDRYVSYLAGEGGRPSMEGFGPEEQHVLLDMSRIIQANWVIEVELPPLEEDPVALALGLVPSSTSGVAVVAGDRVRTLRQALKLSRSQLVAATSAQGWSLSASEMAIIERAETEVLATPHAAALARALRTGIDALAPTADGPIKEFLAWLHSDDFDREVASWAADHNRDPKDVAREVRSKMMAPSRRSSGPGGPTRWLQTLRAILEAME